MRKTCNTCGHLRQFGRTSTPDVWYACDEIKKAVNKGVKVSSYYDVLEIRRDQIKSFYCKYFTKREGERKHG